MKRITVWVECPEGKMEEVIRKVEEYLRILGLEFTILPTKDDVFREERSK